MLTKVQLDERLHYVTGSDAAIIAGLSPYKTRAQLWLEKTKRAEQEDISGANHIKFGTFMEDGVAKWFAAETGFLVTEPPPGLLIHPDYPWMAGNLDRLVADGKPGKAMLECKTAARSDEWGDGENIIPTLYLMQVAHYCAVGGFDRAYIAVVFTMTREFRYYVYERNLALEEKLIKLESEFWHNHVVADVPPVAVSEKDILALFPQSTDKPIIATDEIESYVYAYKDFNSQVAGLEEEKRYMRDRIALYMEDHDVLVSASGEKLVSWKSTKEVERFDTKLLQSEHPDLYTKYLKKGAANRPFKVTAKGDQL